MRIAAVVLSRGQEAFAPCIARAISSQTVKPDMVLAVMDRPSPSEREATERAYAGIPGVEFLSVECAPDTVRRPPMRDGQEPFCAGHCRNLALELLDGRYELAVFIDGDCAPSRGWIESFRLAYGEGRVIVGRRRETKWLGMDQRQCSQEHPVDIFGPVPREVTEEWKFVDSGVMWTCNVGFTPGAVRGIRKINSDLYGVSTVFHPDFTGRWGGEDGFLGMECFYGGVPVWTAPATGMDGVYHMEHPRPSDTYGHRGFIRFMEEKRRELVLLLGAAGKWKGGLRSAASILEGRDGKE